ncbi:SOS response-associated peptidase [Alcaligenes faecalis subsp. phenolicus]|uniref:SOS response-associated peptidase n=1 Tax=Alcaligenes nematophilus TaxID=2994643 RepID=UPI002AA35DD7|nr:SOS response-associated peptidase [Alcaligenes phenolicus]
MCGRINQPDSAIEYGKQLYPEHPELFRQLGTGPRHNVPPGTEPITLHQLTGEPAASRLFWGYRPHWFDKAPVINARLDTILKKSPFWRATLKHRVIVPVAGWFEWTGEKGDKQPWFIHARDGQTIFLAGVSAGKLDAEPGPESGFAIVTDDSAGGMVDIHDRRPVALKPDDAREWLDPGLEVEAALELLSTARGESAFQWHPVTRRIGNARYQRPDATTPIQP